MSGTVVHRGAPNQPESASHSVDAAVSAGSSMVAAQAIWPSGRREQVSRIACQQDLSVAVALGLPSREGEAREPARFSQQ
ncbi:hypothetical protein GCM10009608_26710 [Pseudonocardia alaniniphila]